MVDSGLLSNAQGYIEKKHLEKVRHLQEGGCSWVQFAVALHLMDKNAKS